MLKFVVGLLCENADLNQWFAITEPALEGGDAEEGDAVDAEEVGGLSGRTGSGPGFQKFLGPEGDIGEAGG